MGETIMIDTDEFSHVYIRELIEWHLDKQKSCEDFAECHGEPHAASFNSSARRHEHTAALLLDYLQLLEDIDNNANQI